MVYPNIQFGKQDGNVLIISLILLAAITLFGLTSMRGTLLEEKIAINQQDQHLAMEGAQSCLPIARTNIRKAGSDRPKWGDPGYYITYGHNRDVPDLLDENAWNDDNSTTIPAGLWAADASSKVRPTTTPRCKYEEFAAPGSDLDTGTGETLEQKKVRSKTYYRLFGRGQGADGAEAVVESVSVREI